MPNNLKSEFSERNISITISMHILNSIQIFVWLNIILINIKLKISIPNKTIKNNIMKKVILFLITFQLFEERNPQQVNLNHFVDAENLFLSYIDKTLISHRFYLRLFCRPKML